MPSALGMGQRAGLSKAPLSPADGPYLVIVEQPKQVSEGKEWCGMASALRADGVVVAGWPWGGSLTTEATLRWDGWPLLISRVVVVQDRH